MRVAKLRRLKRKARLARQRERLEGFWRRMITLRTLEPEGSPVDFWQRRLLGLLRVRPRQTATECAHGRLRPGRLCPRCQLVGTR